MSTGTRARPRLRSQHRLTAVAVMLVAVGLQVAGSVLLKVLAEASTSRSLLLVAPGIAAVLVLNLLRLGVWGVAHQRFPLSTSFPLSSLFFPAMLGVAYAFGEPVGGRQIAGAVLITAGTAWLAARVRPTPPVEP
jgi:drug/metabolite transporter (DMT)-like permease